jgi:hypothetical protein
LVNISDMHFGCRMGLCPPWPIALDGGGTYHASAAQATLWRWWTEFFVEFVPHVTKGEPWALLVNGDSLDGVHHGSTTQVSQDLEDQQEIAYHAMQPIVDACAGLYWIRGTPAHVGQSGVEEERIAKRLGAIPNAEGQHARHDGWFRVGRGLVHALHHVGTCGAAAYESSAIMSELVAAYTEAARWHDEPPDVIARGHRHRHIEVRWPTYKGIGIGYSTPAWQLKTPFAYKVAGARQSSPMIGGSIVCCGDHDVYTRHYVQRVERSAEVAV